LYRKGELPGLQEIVISGNSGGSLNYKKALFLGILGTLLHPHTTIKSILEPIIAKPH
jgi:hypothetical protein